MSVDKSYSKEINWKIIESYFNGKHLERLVRHQIESYDHFVGYQIRKTIEMFNPVTIHSEHDKDIETGLYALEMIITFDNFQIYRPQIHENNGATKTMFPQEARLRNFTYSAPLYTDVTVELIDRKGEQTKTDRKEYKYFSNYFWSCTNVGVFRYSYWDDIIHF